VALEVSLLDVTVLLDADYEAFVEREGD